MSKRRLGNLPRAVDIASELDRVGGGHQDGIGGQSTGFDRHPRRDMDDMAKPAVFHDLEIGARIIASHNSSRPQPVATAKPQVLGAEPSRIRSFLWAGV